jgi:hypothetical protein
MSTCKYNLFSHARSSQKLIYHRVAQGFTNILFHARSLRSLKSAKNAKKTFILIVSNPRQMSLSFRSQPFDALCLLRVVSLSNHELCVRQIFISHVLRLSPSVSVRRSRHGNIS